MRFPLGVAGSLCVCFFAVVLPYSAHAATLQVSPSGTVAAGGTVSVTVRVTTDKAMNAASGIVKFQPDLLQVVSVSKAGSIINLWAQEPSYSNSAGTVNFEGVVLNPGYTGGSGAIMTITFRTLKLGVAPVTLMGASVLANDGNGTELLTGTSGATIAVGTGAPAPSGSGISITSPTHPDPAKWYSIRAARLAWKNPPGTEAVRIQYDKNPNGAPSVVYEPPVESKEVEPGDGTWYFHVQARTSAGWGPVSHFRFRIDTTPPRPLSITFPHGTVSKDPRPVILFNTDDDVSGIDHYDVRVEGMGVVSVANDDVDSNPYPIPEQNPGKGRVSVLAYDRAGNVSEDTKEFEVVGIDAPRLDPISNLATDDILIVSGTTYPSARVDVFVKDRYGAARTQWGRTAENGAFRVVWSEGLTPGTYEVTVQTTDDKGAKSYLSDPITVRVTNGPVFSIAGFSIYPWMIGALVLVLATSVAFAVMHGFYHHPRRARGGGHVNAMIHAEFEDLKEAIAEEVAALNRVRSKRELTVEEERLVARLTKMLEKSERRITKEVVAGAE